MYTITVDAPRHLVEVVLGGMMSLEETGAYMADLRRAIDTNRLTRDFAMVVDVSACPIQSQEMVTAMGQYMAVMPKARALAIVTGSSLARMQVRRLFRQSYARITRTPEEGRAWVLDGTEPLAA